MSAMVHHLEPPADLVARFEQQELEEAERAARIRRERWAMGLYKDEDDEIAHHAHRLYMAEKARALVAANGWQPPVDDGSLADQLAEPEDDLKWTIDRLAFAGANVLITAEAKAGKTVLSLNVLRAIVDGQRLFDHFGVQRLKKRETVAWWNAELTRTQAKKWMREMGFNHPERVHPLHLRGINMPIESRLVEDWAVNWLRDRRVKVWILDPKSALFDGEENSSTENSLWLKALDRIKARAGVETLFLIHHSSMGANHDDEEDHSSKLLKPRGSTRLVGWADVLWSYTGRYNEPRYLAAIGRDVDVDPFGGLRYVEGDRTLIWDGNTASPSQATTENRAIKVRDIVAAHPGINNGHLKAKLPGKTDIKARAIAEAVLQGYVIETPGKGNSKVYTLGEVSPHRLSLTPSDPSQTPPQGSQ